MYILNENIRRLRKETGMTQRELAEKLDISDKTISRWESGVQIPDAETVPKLAALFSVTISELYGEEVRAPLSSAPEMPEPPESPIPHYPPAEKRHIHTIWLGMTIGALMVLCGSLALCLNNFYTILVHTVGYLPFFGNQNGRTLGLVLFGAGSLCIAAVLTVYALWYRKPARYNPRYADKASSLNLFTIILFCALLLFLLPRFLGFAVTPTYVIILYSAAFFANILLTVQKRGLKRRHSVKTSAVITVISWTLGGLSLAALAICLDLHAFDLMESLVVHRDVTFSDSAALNMTLQLLYDVTLNQWFGGAYYYFLLTTSVPLSAMLLLNAIELKVRSHRLNKENPTEYTDIPKKHRLPLRILSAAVVLLLLAGSVYGILSVSGVLFRYESVEVLTDSMSPTLHSGDTVSFCTSADMELLWQWDVILFETPDSEQMIGRIMRINSDSDFRAASYVVDQDNPDIKDKRLVYPQDVIGVWLDAPRPASSDDEETGTFHSVTDRGISFPLMP